MISVASKTLVVPADVLAIFKELSPFAKSLQMEIYNLMPIQFDLHFTTIKVRLALGAGKARNLY